MVTTFLSHPPHPPPPTARPQRFIIFARLFSHAAGTRASFKWTLTVSLSSPDFTPPLEYLRYTPLQTTCFVSHFKGKQCVGRAITAPPSGPVAHYPLACSAFCPQHVTTFVISAGAKCFRERPITRPVLKSL